MSKSHSRTASTSSTTFTSSLYKFIPSQPAPSLGYTLTIRQQPVHARICTVPERDRRPIDPPPILRMSLDTLDPEEEQYHTQSPHYFMCANLVHAHDDSKLYLPVQNYLTGTIVSSLHRLKDIDNTDGAFFVFGDLAVKEEGEFRLLFTLFQVENLVVRTRKTILSDVLTVYAPRHFPGPLASTFLSRSFSDQGVRMRIRKEHRIQVSSPRKRKQVENDKPANRRKFRASPLSDDTTSEASVTTTDEQKPQKIEQITPSKPPSPINKIAPPQPLPQSSMSSQPPYSATTTLPPLTSLPNPSYNSAPLNVSIHREPLTGFPLFQQVMPDIAQYHLSSQKTYSPETTPQLPAPNHHPRDPLGLPRQETCRPGYDYPSDPFESGSMKNSNRPLFP